MSYEDCQKIVDSTQHIFEGTDFSIDYYLDGEPYFTFKGEIIDWDELPNNIRTEFETLLNTIEIEY